MATGLTAITGVTGQIKGKLSSKSDIDSGEITNPGPSASIGLNIDDISEIGKSLSPVRDSVIRDTMKAPPKTSIGIGIGASPKGNLGISVEVPIPVPAPVSARGAIAIDPATGKIRGGGLGLGLGKGPIGISLDIGVDTPPGSDKLGCFKYVTVSLSIFSHTFGKNECEPKAPAPAPAIPGSPSIPLPQDDIKQLPPFININRVKGCTLKVSWQENHQLIHPYSLGCDYLLLQGGYPYTNNRPTNVTIISKTCKQEPRPADQYGPNPFTAYVDAIYQLEVTWVIGSSQSQSYLDSVLGYIYYYYVPSSFCSYNTIYGLPIISSRKVSEPIITVFNCSPAKENNNIYSPSSPPSPSPSFSPPIPNPPPRKKMDEDCCKRIEILQLETLRMLGRQVVGGKMAPISNTKGFLGEETERIKTPIKDATKPEKEKIQFGTLYEMLLYELKQTIILNADLEDIKDAFDIKAIKEMKGQNKGRMIEKSIPIESGKKRAKLEDKTITTYAGAIDVILSELDAFANILHSDYLIEKKFPIPGYLLAPGVNPHEVHEVESYYELFGCLIQAMAHGLIVSPEVHMRDPTTGKSGDEGMTSKYLSATGWAEAITKMLYKTIDEGNISINMDIRNGITVTQLAVTIADMSHKIDTIIDCIGVPTSRSKGEIETSFSLIDDSDKGQGFDPKKNNKQLNLNEEKATEKLLAMLLKTRKNPIIKESMSPKAKSLSQLIQELKGG